MRTVRVKDEAGKTTATIEVWPSSRYAGLNGRYVGLDVRNGGVPVLLDLNPDEVAQLISALALTLAEVIEQNR